MTDSELARRVLLASAIVALVLAIAALMAWHPEILLLAFSGVLAAVLLDALARPLLRTGMPRVAAIGLVVLAILALMAGGALFMGPRLVHQATALMDRLPEMIVSAERALSETVLGQHAIDAIDAASAPNGNGDTPTLWQRAAPFVFGSVAGVFTTTLGAAAGTAAVAALAIFIALQPEAYLEGALRLAPRTYRPRLREVAGAAGLALRWWIVGRGVAMALVALLTAVGLALLGVDLALALGLIAGLLTIVPFVGPILAAVPAVLVALTSSPSSILPVIALYTGVQLIENNVITPVVQGRAISLPPALLIVAQVLMAVLLGGLGVLLATPILVVIVVLVQGLYINDVLGERVTLLGAERTGSTRRRGTSLA